MQQDDEKVPTKAQVIKAIKRLPPALQERLHPPTTARADPTQTTEQVESERLETLSVIAAALAVAEAERIKDPKARTRILARRAAAFTSIGLTFGGTYTIFVGVLNANPDLILLGEAETGAGVAGTYAAASATGIAVEKTHHPHGISTEGYSRVRHRHSVSAINMTTDSNDAVNAQLQTEAFVIESLKIARERPRDCVTILSAARGGVLNSYLAPDTETPFSL